MAAPADVTSRIAFEWIARLGYTTGIRVASGNSKWAMSKAYAKIKLASGKSGWLQESQGAFGKVRVATGRSEWLRESQGGFGQVRMDS